jgi:hypothetical protein
MYFIIFSDIGNGLTDQGPLSLLSRREVLGSECFVEKPSPSLRLERLAHWRQPGLEDQQNDSADDGPKITGENRRLRSLTTMSIKAILQQLRGILHFEGYSTS